MFRSKREPSRIPAYLVLAILGLFAVGPIALLALNSLKTTNEIRANPFGLPPNWLFSNYVEAWVQGAFTTTLINTSILTGSTILGVVVIGGVVLLNLSGGFSLALETVMRQFGFLP